MVTQIGRGESSAWFNIKFKEKNGPGIFDGTFGVSLERMIDWGG